MSKHTYWLGNRKTQKNKLLIACNNFSESKDWVGNANAINMLVRT